MLTFFVIIAKHTFFLKNSFQKKRTVFVAKRSSEISLWITLLISPVSIVGKAYFFFHPKLVQKLRKQNTDFMPVLSIL